MGSTGGWNRSTANQPVKKGGAKAPSMWKGIAAGLVIVSALGGLCLWIFSGGEDAPKAKVEKERGRIKEVAPAAAPVAKTEDDSLAKKKAEVARRKHYWDDKIKADENGVLRYPGGLRYKGPNDYVHKVKDTRPPPRFKRFSSNQIATLLEITPGEIPVGGMQFPKKFTEDFKASLKEEIEILETDSEYDVELKKAVIDAKKELAERMKNGEDPREICEQTWKEMQEIGLYREELVKQINAIRQNPDMTANDIKDAVDAANLMLKEKGAKGIGISKIALKRLAERDRRRGLMK